MFIKNSRIKMILFFTNIHDYVEIYVYTLIICNLQPRDIYILLLEIYLLLRTI